MAIRYAVMRLALTSILMAASAVLLTGQQQRASNVESALRAFLSADTADRRAAAISDVLATGATYDELAARLNTFDVQSRGVSTFTLLLSPDVVTVSSPVSVIVSGPSGTRGTGGEERTYAADMGSARQ